MYFWRIEELKSEMASRPYTERDVLPYLILYVVASTAVIYLPNSLATLWDRLNALMTVAAAALGTQYLYHRNGGDQGQQFMARYFAIGWVFFVRFVVFFSAAVLVFGIALAVLASPQAMASKESGSVWEFAITTVLVGLYYWLLGRHLNDLSQRKLAVATKIRSTRSKRVQVTAKRSKRRT